VVTPFQPNLGINVGLYMPSSGSNRLTALTVKKANAKGRYPDGNCLYLVVGESGAKHWLLRIVVRGKRRDIGLGSASLVDSGASWSSTSGKLNWPVKG
jgi:hypothetical protein